MGKLRRHFDGLQQSNPNALRKFGEDVDLALDNIYSVLGSAGLKFGDDPNNPQPAPLPSPAGFLVTGVDGKFKTFVTNPQDVLPQSFGIARQQALDGGNPVNAAIVHNLQSATDTNFNNASNLKDYGTSAQLSWEDQDPNVTRFFRLRSSFDGQNWNAWQLFSTAQSCGPVGVASGFLRSTSAAPNASVNNSNNCTADSIDAGASATIRVYGPGGVGTSWTHFDGQGGATLVSAGTILGAGYSTQFLAMFSTTQGYRAFPPATQYALALADDLLWAGKVTTVAAGGAGGSSGGGGSTGGGSGGGRGLIL